MEGAVPHPRGLIIIPELSVQDSWGNSGAQETYQDRISV